MKKNIIFLILTSWALQGCIFAVGAAAGAAGIAAVYDHRKIDTVLTDQRIANRILDKIFLNTNLRDNSHINVTSYNRVVLLTGEANSPAYKAQAEQTAKSIDGITKVYNEITITGSASPLSRASDSWISTKIKTQMLATKDLKSGSIKVVTENGSVYLMGIVTHDQADTAVEIAQNVSGVQKVVKIFQYR